MADGNAEREGLRRPPPVLLRLISLGGAIAAITAVLALLGGFDRHSPPEARTSRTDGGAQDELGLAGEPGLLEDLAIPDAASAVPDGGGLARNAVRQVADTQTASGPQPQPAPEAGERADGLSDEQVLQLYEEAGMTIGMVTAPYRQEFQGNANQELDLIETSHTLETVMSLGPYELNRATERTPLPDRKIGEYERCRVWFGADGRAFLSVSLRRPAEDGGKLVEFRGQYELEVLRGTEADFQAGKPVLFKYSAKGLDRSKQDCVQIAEDGYQALLEKQFAEDPLTNAITDRLRVTMAYERFSNALILASPSSVVTEEEEPSVGVLRATFSSD